MISVNITAIGNSSGIILPKEVLLDMQIGKGDKLFLTKAAGGYKLSPYDDELAKQIETGEKVMRKYRDAFKALADK